MASALSRRCREGSLERTDRDQLLHDLNEDLKALYLVELVPEVVARAGALLLQHPLRAADAVQLASCLVLQEKVDRPITFASYDQLLLEASRRQGLDVFDSEESV